MEKRIIFFLVFCFFAKSVFCGPKIINSTNHNIVLKVIFNFNNSDSEINFDLSPKNSVSLPYGERIKEIRVSSEKNRFYGGMGTRGSGWVTIFPDVFMSSICIDSLSSYEIIFDKSFIKSSGKNGKRYYLCLVDEDCLIDDDSDSELEDY